MIGNVLGVPTSVKIHFSSDTGRIIPFDLHCTLMKRLLHPGVMLALPAASSPTIPQADWAPRAYQVLMSACCGPAAAGRGTSG
jgi:hypothetical protein